MGEQEQDRTLTTTTPSTPDEAWQKYVDPILWDIAEWRDPEGYVPFEEYRLYCNITNGADPYSIQMKCQLCRNAKGKPMELSNEHVWESQHVEKYEQREEKMRLLEFVVDQWDQDARLYPAGREFPHLICVSDFDHALCCRCVKIRY